MQGPHAADPPFRTANSCCAQRGNEPAWLWDQDIPDAGLNSLGERPDPGGDDMPKGKAPYLIAGIFLLTTLAINVVFVPYPTDNDLDEIGWLVQHLSISRLESLANVNYPPGLPVLLRTLIPITGDLVRTALVLQALACTAIVLIASRIALCLLEDSRGAVWTAFLVAGLTLRLATSEFADGIATALVLAGISVLIVSGGDRRRDFLSGALIGLAYLFRYHYLTFGILVPVASLVLSPAEGRGRRALTIATGFTAGCSPLLLVNLLARGNPFYTGISTFIMGQHVMGSVDWDNFLATYNIWPMGRLLSEEPWRVFQHLTAAAASLSTRPTILSGMLLIPISAGILRHTEARRILTFLALCVAAYLALAVLPTLATDRAMLPADVLLGLLCVPAVYCGTRTLCKGRPGVHVVLVGAALLMLFSLPTTAHHLRKKANGLAYNRILCDRLNAAGGWDSAAVFSNHWNLYPVDDPNFVTYYNYGGWLLLDSVYAAERPAPEACTVDEWRDFMREHALRYLVIRKTDRTAAFFSEGLAAAEWEVVHFDGALAILRLRSPTG
jgi:hypothetical protein